MVKFILSRTVYRLLNSARHPSGKKPDCVLCTCMNENRSAEHLCAQQRLCILKLLNSCIR